MAGEKKGPRAEQDNAGGHTEHEEHTRAGDGGQGAKRTPTIPAPDLAKCKAELTILFLAYGTAVADGRRRDAHRYRADFAALLDAATGAVA